MCFEAWCVGNSVLTSPLITAFNYSNANCYNLIKYFSNFTFFNLWRS